jgi:D-alanyl-D-alanine carboxypeptidase
MSDETFLQDALARSGQDHGPGLFGLVTEAGQVVFAGSAGAADLTRPRPPAARDLFRIGSVTKVYVAALVLALADEGVLSLADPVQRWLPGVVPGGEQITVEMLLRLRSGLPDYLGLLFGDPPDLRVLDRYWPPGELIGLALAAGDRWPPGAGYRYSNTDYVLLGLVIERAAGQRVDALLWQKIFQPLDLRDTVFPVADPYLRGPHAAFPGTGHRSLRIGGRLRGLRARGRDGRLHDRRHADQGRPVRHLVAERLRLPRPDDLVDAIHPGRP